MDGLDDLQLIGFDDPSSSLPEPSSPHPISSDSTQAFPQIPDAVTGTNRSTSPSPTPYPASSLSSLNLFEDGPALQPGPSHPLASGSSPSLSSSGHGWFEARPRPRRSAGFSPESYGMFAVPIIPGQQSSLQPSPLRLRAPGPSIGGGDRAQDLSNEPVAGPSGWSSLNQAPTQDALMSAHLSDPYPGGGNITYPQDRLVIPGLNPTEQFPPSMLAIPAYHPPPSRPMPEYSPRKRIVHGAFSYGGVDTSWIEEVDPEQVRAFLATPSTESHTPLPSRGEQSATPSPLANISPRSLWRILDFGALLRSVLQRLLSFAQWKQFLLRLLLQYLPRRTQFSSQAGPSRSLPDESPSQPGDDDWEAYGAYMIAVLPSLGKAAFPMQRIGLDGLPAEEETPLPIRPPYWPKGDVVPIVHRPAAEYLLCPLLRHRPYGTAALRWDVRTTNFGDMPTDHTREMLQPATWPLCSKLVVSCCADDPLPDWPWPITIFNPYGVTFHDVVVAIRENLVQAVWPHEWEELHLERRNAIERLQTIRAMAHPLEHPLPDSNDDEVLRLDCLLGHTFFRGLSPSPDGDGWMMHFGAP